VSKRSLTDSELAALAAAQQWSAEEGERVVATWRRSGLSMRAFAKQHGLVAQRLHWWRRRIEGEARPESKPKTKRRPASAIEEARLVPVVLRAPQVQLGPAIAVRHGDTVLEVREPGIVSPEWIAALMLELSRLAP
jgi:transposase-like protein